MNGMDVCHINTHLPRFSFMSLIYCYTTAQENAGTNLYY